MPTNVHSAGDPKATVVISRPPVAAPFDVPLAPPVHASDIGSLGRYRVKGQLGEGAMGVVFLAFDTALQRKLALKVLRPSDARDPVVRERFLREARAAAQVRSPHVVTIFDVAEEFGNPIIAMEHLKGYSIDRYLTSKGEIPISHVLRIGIEMGLGLSAAHKLGIVHRDIKPANVWLSAPNGSVKILDFGLARQVYDPQLTETGALLGTPLYMSPEQARGEQLDARSDLFSAGTLLYRLSTGHLPFRGQTVFTVLNSVATEAPERPRGLNPRVPESLERVLLKLLEKDPDDRYQSAAELVRALQEVIASETTPSTENEHKVLPLVIQPAPESVWSGIDDTAAPDSNPNAPRSRPRNWFAYGAIASLVAVGAVALTLAPNRRDANPINGASAKAPDAPKEQTPKTKPPSTPPQPPIQPVKPEKPEQSIPPPVVERDLTPEHLLAKWVLDQQGSLVAVTGDFADGRVNNYAAIPKGAITLHQVLLEGAKGVTDNDLKRFAKVPNLTVLDLNDTSVSSAGMEHLRGMTKLTMFSCHGTAVGDDGLKCLSGCTELRYVAVSSCTEVSFAGLAHLKKCNQLCEINASGCPRITADGLDVLAHFAKAGSIILTETKVTVDDALKLSPKFPGWTFQFADCSVKNGKPSKTAP